uniref:Uncharacterized protein n=1 Tax=Pseudo-nitzschia australis TaxID=44445 RepID=A0A6U9Y712_9STRA
MIKTTFESTPNDNGPGPMASQAPRISNPPSSLAAFALDDRSQVQTEAEKLAARQEHIRHMKSLYLIVNNKYFINFLSERYFSKMQMFLIFIPIQTLAVWATVSKPFFSYLNGAPVDGPAVEGAGDALINTLVGASLLILTNLGKALSFEKKAEQHKLAAGEMKAVMDDITVHLSTLPTSGFDCDKSTSIRKNVELVFAKHVEMNKQLSPPEQIVMAFDNIDDDITFLLKKRDEYGATSTSDGSKCHKPSVIKIMDKFYDVDEETYFNVFRDGYSDLADIISARIAHCIRFAFLPSSKDARIETIAGIVETLDRMGGCAPEEKGLCARLFRTPVRQSEEKGSLLDLTSKMDDSEFSFNHK